MQLSKQERERLAQWVHSARDEAKITQEQAARLLGIAKNTWIRWESGEFRPDPLKLELLPYLARNVCTEPCYESRARKWDGQWMAGHLRTCRNCWLAINYLAIVAKACPHKRQRIFPEARTGARI
jgi:transcriptional regulator with XRE-family HTH domain